MSVSVVDESYFIVAFIAFGVLVFGHCFVMQYLKSVHSSIADRHLAEEERANCFTYM